MQIERTNNTKERGTMEFLVYSEDGKFVGVCLTFDIIEEGNDPVALMKSLKEAAELHLETVIKNNLPDTLLNRYAPAEYWEKYFSAARQIEKPQTPSSGFLTVSPYSSQMTPQFA
jgi:predicted RNase H-like HicB family nuclease